MRRNASNRVAQFNIKWIPHVYVALWATKLCCVYITTSILILSNTTLVKRYVDAYSSNEKLKYHIPIDSCRGYPSYGRAYEDYKPEYWTLQCHTFVAAVIMQQMEIVSWYLRYPFSISTPAYSMSLYIYTIYIYSIYI